MTSQPTNSAEEAQYCLRWKNHKNNMMDVFNRLLGDEHFTDVLLAAEGRKIRAHKVSLNRLQFVIMPYSELFSVGDILQSRIYILLQVVLSACS